MVGKKYSLCTPTIFDMPSVGSFLGHFFLIIYFRLKIWNIANVTIANVFKIFYSKHLHFLRYAISNFAPDRRYMQKTMQKTMQKNDAKTKVL